MSLLQGFECDKCIYVFGSLKLYHIIPVAKSITKVNLFSMF